MKHTMTSKKRRGGLVAGSKTSRVAEFLVTRGSISNVSAINGDYGFRTARLATIIGNLRSYGWVIDTRVIKDSKKQYVDCVYILSKPA